MLDKPDAFLSYTRFDDRHGKISEFREWLSEAVEEVSGVPFNIFQDIEGIGLGEKWQSVLDEMLDQARFFIPILTPKFFKSIPCRDELIKFLELEGKTGRQDLVLPIYWITCPVLEEGHLKAKDELAQVIDERQRWDWRELRHDEFGSREVQRDLSGLALQIERARRNVLRVVEIPKEAVANGNPEPSKKPVPKLQTVASQPKPVPVRSFQQPKPFEVFRDIDAPWCPEMVVVPAGSFLMGSPTTEKGHSQKEGPQHKVTIDQPFALGRYLITFDEYGHFCDETGHKNLEDWSRGRGRRPVMNVSHEDARAYCAWLSQITKATYQLPTEAMWEYACRAGTTTRYAFGDEISDKQANFHGGVGSIVEVGNYPANKWGLHDMHGNVGEWCADGLRVYNINKVTNPQGPMNSDALRVLRGGSWDDDAPFLRSARRSEHRPDYRNASIGFRCSRVHDPIGR